MRKQPLLRRARLICCWGWWRGWRFGTGLCRLRSCWEGCAQGRFWRGKLRTVTSGTGSSRKKLYMCSRPKVAGSSFEYPLDSGMLPGMNVWLTNFSSLSPYSQAPCSSHSSTLASQPPHRGISTPSGNHLPPSPPKWSSSISPSSAPTQLGSYPNAPKILMS